MKAVFFPIQVGEITEVPTSKHEKQYVQKLKQVVKNTRNTVTLHAHSNKNIG